MCSTAVSQRKVVPCNSKGRCVEHRIEFPDIWPLLKPVKDEYAKMKSGSWTRPTPLCRSTQNLFRRRCYGLSSRRGDRNKENYSPWFFLGGRLTPNNIIVFDIVWLKPWCPLPFSIVSRDCVCSAQVRICSLKLEPVARVRHHNIEESARKSC